MNQKKQLDDLLLTKIFLKCTHCISTSNISSKCISSKVKLFCFLKTVEKIYNCCFFFRMKIKKTTVLIFILKFSFLFFWRKKIFNKSKFD